MRRLFTSLFSIPFAVASLSACANFPGEEIRPIGPQDDVITELNLLDLDESFQVTKGVSVDPRTGDLVFLTNAAIVVLDQQGTEKARLATEGFVTGPSGFGVIEEGVEVPDRDYSLSTFGDIASLGDGTYALPMANMVRRYDPETGRAEDYFCLLPGTVFQEMHNEAVALNLSDDEIIGAPVITEESNIVSNDLVRYSASTAELQDANAIGDNIFAKGLAVVPNSDRLLAVEGSTIYLLSRDGAVLSSHELVGIEDASGIALLPEHNIVYVIDEIDSSLKAFPLDAVIVEPGF